MIILLRSRASFEFSPFFPRMLHGEPDDAYLVVAEAPSTKLIVVEPTEPKLRPAGMTLRTSSCCVIDSSLVSPLKSLVLKCRLRVVNCGRKHSNLSAVYSCQPLAEFSKTSIAGTLQATSDLLVAILDEQPEDLE